jgi:DNA-binding CsgD family transcriptional regulator
MNIQVDLARTGGRWSCINDSYPATPVVLAGQIAEMATELGADRYATLRLGAVGSRTASAVVSALSSIGVDDDCLGLPGAMLIEQIAGHMERSVVPLVYLAGGAAAMPSGCCTARLRVDSELFRELDGRSLLILPVKLGGGSDGAMIFAGRGLRPDIVQILDMHRRAHGIFKSLLGLDLEKSAPRQNLNDRELECLQLAGEGLKSELIARRLKLSVHTVNAYLSTATAKLDSVNRIQAIAKAIRLGYLA